MPACRSLRGNHFGWWMHEVLLVPRFAWLVPFRHLAHCEGHYAGNNPECPFELWQSVSNYFFVLGCFAIHSDIVFNVCQLGELEIIVVYGTLGDGNQPHFLAQCIQRRWQGNMQIGCDALWVLYAFLLSAEISTRPLACIPFQ